MNTRKVQIEFWQKVKYMAEIEVTEKEYQMLTAFDGDDIRESGNYENETEAFHLIDGRTDRSNVFDAQDEIIDFEIKELEEE